MPNELDDVKVGAIAVKNPLTMTEDMHVSKAAEKMLREKVHSIVIVDKNSKPVGMLSAWDVLKIAFLSESARELPVSKLIEGQKLLFLYEEVSIRDSIALMVDKGVRSLPVLDEKDKLVGKISLTDIARFIVEKL